MIENESLETEWVTSEDEYGVYKTRINPLGIEELLIISRTQKWHDENPSEPEPLPEPTEIELLQQENAMLQMGMMEMTMYAAMQDERLQTQENAVMELSMLIAGGGM